MDQLSGSLGGKQYDHGNYARAQQNQYESSEELGNQLGGQ